MAINFNDIFKAGALSGQDGKAPKAKDGKGESDTLDAVPLGAYDDQELLDLWERIRKEALEERWVFERQWHRNILYTLGRQWIEYYQGRGGWKDKRMAPWIPRPVTNKCKETVQAIRAMFTSIKLGVNVRPNGSIPANVSTAAVADELAPVLHEAHSMDANLTEFDEVPYIVRLRWRTKRYFQDRKELQPLVSGISWQKSPNDQSLQLFKSLASHNDLGIAPAYLADGTTSSNDNEEGIPEYEVWYKPTDAYPDGLVFRVIGDKDPQILHLEDNEAIPGPFPYKDASGKPVFTFTHAGYEHVGGRILASGPLDVIIQKQDQLNQLDSMILLIIQRMSNPIWLEPKGAEIEKLTGMPGLVVKWNPLTVGGNAKPERIEGIGPDASLFTIREQYLKDIEELAGTFDIVKGAKPTGVEAFSALQLLVERSQSRFAGVFAARGKAYRDWYQFAIELEREFGPDQRTSAIMTPARTWQFKNFKNAQLGGAVTVVIEDGTNAPKTSLGMRAALEHANQLGMLDMQDPDQRYEGLKLFGLTRMAPTLDIHVQSALQKQQAFEEWATNPAAQQQSFIQAQAAFTDYNAKLGQAAAVATDPTQLPQAPSENQFTPLKWLPWYNPQIHRQEFMKWANGDTVRELLQQQPALEQLLVTHLMEIDAAMAQQAMQAAMLSGAVAPAQTPSSGAMGRSNKESTQGNEPKGNKESAQNHGPA